jgi:hypothetical protein
VEWAYILVAIVAVVVYFGSKVFIERALQGPRPTLAQVLARVSNGWSAPLVVRQYSTDQAGQNQLMAEAKLFDDNGYEAMASSADGGHVHAGRLILTGGLAALGGPDQIRSQGTITITYKRKARPE